PGHLCVDCARGAAQRFPACRPMRAHRSGWNRETRMITNSQALRRLVLLGAALLAASAPALAASPAAVAGSNAQRPNILLVISDDIGLDANTDMYPGLIDALVKQYGP